jgi:hypothetical protein
VDAALDIEPGRDLTGDLARAEATENVSVGAGSLTAAAFALAPLPGGGLRVTVAVALAIQLAYLLAVALLVRGAAGARTDLRRESVLGTMRMALRTGWQRPVRLLLAVELLWGAGMSTVELLWQPTTGREAGPDNGWIFGAMGAAGWAAAAAGAALLPPLVRLLGGRVVRAAALLRVGQGLALLPLALTTGGRPATRSSTPRSIVKAADRHSSDHARSRPSRARTPARRPTSLMRRSRDGAARLPRPGRPLPPHARRAPRQFAFAARPRRMAEMRKKMAPGTA